MAVMKGLGFLSEAEASLVRETEPERLALLDEDAALEVHKRIRKARNKHVGKYRRQGAAKVGDKGGRGSANRANVKARERAEVFELALSRVSQRVDVLARASAAELKAERLAAASAAKAGGAAAARETGSPEAGSGKVSSGDGRTAAKSKTAASMKQSAATKAAGARRQAKRDTR